MAELPLKDRITAKLQSGAVLALYPSLTSKRTVRHAASISESVCLCCDQPISGPSMEIVYQLSNGSVHTYHLRCDTPRLAMAAELLIGGILDHLAQPER